MLDTQSIYQCFTQDQLFIYYSIGVNHTLIEKVTTQDMQWIFDSIFVGLGADHQQTSNPAKIEVEAAAKTCDVMQAVSSRMGRVLCHL